MALTDAQRKALLGDDTDTSTPAVKPASAAPPTTPPASTTTAPTTTTPSTPPQGSSFWQRPVTDFLPSWMQPGPGIHNRALALEAGVKQGINRVGTNLGINMQPPPQEQQTAAANYPTTAGVGQLGGEVAATAPALLASEAIPEAAAARFAPNALRWAGEAVPKVLQWGGRGAAAGAEQNVLAGDPNEPTGDRALAGAITGIPFGVAGGKLGDWFGASKTLDPDVVNAARTAQREGISNIGEENLNQSTIKSMGATPSPETGRQIDAATGRILGEKNNDWSPKSVEAAQNRIGSAVTSAANSGKVWASPGFMQALDTVQQQAQANNVGGRIDPLIAQIKSHINNGVISGSDFDKLVGNGSTLHDLVGDADPYVKQAAQALDHAMDSGFKFSSPAGAYDNWVDARTKYRLLMAVRQNILPNGHVNPTTLFTSVQSRFPDLKALPASAASDVGRMGELASAIRTLYGGGAAPRSAPPPGILRSVGEGLGLGGGVEGWNALTGGGFNIPTAAAIPVGAAAATGAARYLGHAFQRTEPFINSLISRGGTAAGNKLLPVITGTGVQATPQSLRRARP